MEAEEDVESEGHKAVTLLLNELIGEPQILECQRDNLSENKKLKYLIHILLFCNEGTHSRSVVVAHYMKCVYITRS